ncbi:phosphotransferase family protein [Altererythrobacter sp. MF3-039]|uniref:phosphotransferase family protein n=1 Tax=Altererythrobacter sp. MF3-039 TaxID=3252901 RepID=UPI00390CCDE6
MPTFPSKPGDVLPQWLTERLREAELLGEGEVSELTWEPIGTGQVGDSARFHLSYSGGSGPATLAGKFPAEDPTSRGTAVMMGLYRKEVGFYRDVAPRLKVRTPGVIASEISDDGGDFILLFEDLGPARGGNQLESCSAPDAREAVKQAAAIHAPSWNSAEIVDQALFQTPPEVTAQLKALYPQAHAVFEERYAGTLEPEFMQLCDELNELSQLIFDHREGDQCIVHGDFRLDNMLFDIKGGSEPIAVLDWQTVTIGNALTDVGYFLGCGIGDELRRAYESELLDLYCYEMTQRGVAMSRKSIWDDYRIGALHGVSTAVFSAAFVERTERGDANFLSMARGACALALEHDSIGALKGRL